MKIKTILLISFLLVLSNSSISGKFTNLENKIEQLNQQSIKLIGISLNALKYLIDANPSSYLLFSYLEKSGQLKYLKELEKAGYVKLEITQGLPDGTEKNTKYLRVIPLFKGIEAQQCFDTMPI